MQEAQYLIILDSLDLVARTLVAHQGDLDEGDLRIRQCISTAAVEARRQVTRKKAALGEPATSARS